METKPRKVHLPANRKKILEEASRIIAISEEWGKEKQIGNKKKQFEVAPGQFVELSTRNVAKMQKDFLSELKVALGQDSKGGVAKKPKETKNINNTFLSRNNFNKIVKLDDEVRDFFIKSDIGVDYNANPLNTTLISLKEGYTTRGLLNSLFYLYSSQHSLYKYAEFNKKETDKKEPNKINKSHIGLDENMKTGLAKCIEKTIDNVKKKDKIFNPNDFTQMSFSSITNACITPVDDKIDEEEWKVYVKEVQTLQETRLDDPSVFTTVIDQMANPSEMLKLTAYIHRDSMILSLSKVDKTNTEETAVIEDTESKE